MRQSDVLANVAIAQQFARDGFAICDAVIEAHELTSVCSDIEQMDVAVGTRNLLDYAWCRELALALHAHPVIAQTVDPDSVPVQCTLFEKSSEKNWLVGLHQDLSIPVNQYIDHSELQGWSRKEGGWFVQAPIDVLTQMVAVRLHLDNCGVDDGALQVVPGSHRHGKLSNADGIGLREQMGAHVCIVPAGGALLMRPLLLHASSKSRGISRRRVLHFVFGPPVLPSGMRWRD